MHYLGNGTEGFQNAIHNPVGVELLSSSIPHTVAIQRLGLFNGLHEDCQRPHVFVRFRTLMSGRQPVHDDARLAMPDERSHSVRDRAAAEFDTDRIVDSIITAVNIA